MVRPAAFLVALALALGSLAMAPDLQVGAGHVGLGGAAWSRSGVMEAEAFDLGDNVDCNPDFDGEHTWAAPDGTASGGAKAFLPHGGCWIDFDAVVFPYAAQLLGVTAQVGGSLAMRTAHIELFVDGVLLAQGDLVQNGAPAWTSVAMTPLGTVAVGTHAVRLVYTMTQGGSFHNLEVDCVKLTRGAGCPPEPPAPACPGTWFADGFEGDQVTAGGPGLQLNKEDFHWWGLPLAPPAAPGGSVDFFLSGGDPALTSAPPGFAASTNGKFVDLDGSTSRTGFLHTSTPMYLPAGTYSIQFRAAGSQRAGPSETVHAHFFQPASMPASLPAVPTWSSPPLAPTAGWATHSFGASAAAPGYWVLGFQTNPVPPAASDNIGPLLDDIAIFCTPVEVPPPPPPPPPPAPVRPPLHAFAGGPYMGPVGTNVAILGWGEGGSGGPYRCLWHAAPTLQVSPAGSCSAAVLSRSGGSFELRITVWDSSGNQSEAWTRVSISNEARDVDRDGIADSADNCPAQPNHGQEDMDRDGPGDACDETPCGTQGCPGETVARGQALHAAALDQDNDGVADRSDSCPAHANPGQEDLDGDGFGDTCDADADGDGLAVPHDPCPMTMGDCLAAQAGVARSPSAALAREASPPDGPRLMLASAGAVGFFLLVALAVVALHRRDAGPP